MNSCNVEEVNEILVYWYIPVLHPTNICRYLTSQKFHSDIYNYIYDNISASILISWIN